MRMIIDDNPRMFAHALEMYSEGDDEYLEGCLNIIEMVTAFKEQETQYISLLPLSYKPKLF